MNLTLDRVESDAYGTFGHLTGKGRQFVYTCEAPWRKHSADGTVQYSYGVPFESCVPAGEYQLVWHNSAKYGWRWHLVGDGVTLERRNETGRFACLFHTLNHPSETSGCIGPGMTIGYPVGRYGVINSLSALQRVEDWLELGENHTLVIR